MRRLVPSPTVRMSSFCIKHSTIKTWACASPPVCTTAYSGTATLRPCKRSCSKDLASLSMTFGSMVLSLSLYKCSTKPSAAAKPPSKYTAPMMASNASAKIDGLRQPALFNSPSPNLRASPTFSAKANSLILASFTNCARKRLKSPSSKPGKR